MEPCPGTLAAAATLGGRRLDRFLSLVSGLCLPHARRISLHRLRQSGGARGRTPALRMVWQDPGPLGRNHSAVACAPAPCRLFLPPSPAGRLHVLLVLLLRELALYRHLHGR